MNRRGFLASLFAFPLFRWPRKSKLLGSIDQVIRSAKAHGIEPTTIIMSRVNLEAVQNELIENRRFFKFDTQGRLILFGLPVEVSNGAGDRIYVVQKWEGIPLERRMTVL